MLNGIMIEKSKISFDVKYKKSEIIKMDEKIAKPPDLVAVTLCELLELILSIRLFLKKIF